MICLRLYSKNVVKLGFEFRGLFLGSESVFVVFRGFEFVVFRLRLWGSFLRSRRSFEEEEFSRLFLGFLGKR